MSHEEGATLANKFGCPYIETSAAHRRHVDEVFHTLVREIKRYKVKRISIGIFIQKIIILLDSFKKYISHITLCQFAICHNFLGGGKQGAGTRRSLEKTMVSCFQKD